MSAGGKGRAPRSKGIPSPVGDSPSRRQRTLLTALLLSTPGPLVTGLAAIRSLSATQIADFIRRTVELAALFVAWYVFRKLHGSAPAAQSRERLERMANRSVAVAMVCSGIAMLAVGVQRLMDREAAGDVTLGLVIALLGLAFNTAFWQRYRSFNRRRFDPVIAGQQRLYRAKSLVDLGVVAALAAVTLAPAHPATPYLDALGSLAVAGYLLRQGLGTARPLQS